jgi:hypothetical protein
MGVGGFDHCDLGNHRKLVVVGDERLENRNRPSAFGHLQLLTAPDSAQIHAQVLTKLTNSDSLHDAQNVEQGGRSVPVFSRVLL